MATLEVNDDQLRLIQTALDFYSRVGIGQMREILSHPTFEDNLEEKTRPHKDKLEVGDRTSRGEIVDIGEGYIQTKGHWGKGEEVKTWKDVENIKLSVDYDLYHKLKDNALQYLTAGRNTVFNNSNIQSPHASYGIHSPQVHKSCRDAFDIVQVIRHEFWKQNENRSNVTVDSSITLCEKENANVKCALDEKKVEKKEK